MKIKFFNPAILFFVIIGFSSCLDADSPNVRERTEAEEINLLKSYINTLKTMGYDVDTTELGVQYITLEEGEGAYPVDGDTLSIEFAGYLIDEALFVSSEALNLTGEQELILGAEGEEKPITGFTDGLKHVRKGGKIHFIVPSSLAYGSDGQGKIAPYQTLVFVVRLFDLKQQTE